MGPTPACSAQTTPEPEFETGPDIYLTIFDWDLVRTPASTVRHPRRKPNTAIQFQCTAKLRAIDAHFGNPAGISKLVEGTRTLMTKSWKIFYLYFDYDAEFPDCERLWSRTEWRKWDLVEFLTRVCEQYHAEILQAEKEGVELVTEELDEEFLSFVEVLLSLGGEGEDVVGIKEWERVGTRTTLKTRSLSGENVKIMKAKRVDVEAEDEEDDDDATFEGAELEDALPSAHTNSASEPPGFGWNMVLTMRNSPMRDSMTPGAGV